MNGHRRLRNVDLNLLLALDALVEERSVTRAAERLGVGQPAMSASLAKLRRLLDDPLLVRDGRGLTTTPVADELAVDVRAAIGLIDGALQSRRSFDPAVAKRTFRVMSSDYVLALFLARLLERLAGEAPHVRFVITPPDGRPLDRLRHDEVDLVILPNELAGPELDPPVGAQGVIHCEALYADRYVCAIDAAHPDVGDHMTREQFASLPYLAYRPAPMVTATELSLADLGVNRPVEVAAQSFVALPLMLRDTRFFTVVQLRLLDLMAGYAGIRWVESPHPLQPITESMFWTSRVDRDPAHRWLRAELASEASRFAAQ